MKAAKCTSCGANLTIDETIEAGICPYCNAMYSTEKAIKNYISNTTNNNTTNAQVINNYYGNKDNTTNIRVARTPRPKLNVGIAILGFIFYIIPGILYVIHIQKKQKEWDDKYTY